MRAMNKVSSQKFLEDAIDPARIKRDAIRPELVEGPCLHVLRQAQYEQNRVGSKRPVLSAGDVDDRQRRHVDDSANSCRGC